MLKINPMDRKSMTQKNNAATAKVSNWIRIFNLDQHSLIVINNLPIINLLFNI